MRPLALLASVLLLLSGSPVAEAKKKRGKKRPMTAADVMKTHRVKEARVSPAGTFVAYVVERQRGPNDEAGTPYRELYLVPVTGGEARPFVTGDVAVRGVRWSPDGRHIGFIQKRGGDKSKAQVWAIPVDGGEAEQVTTSPSGIKAFAWRPGHPELAFISVPDKTKKRKALEKKGYGFIYYQEQRRPRILYLQRLPWAPKLNKKKKDAGKARQLTKKVSVWDMAWSRDGKQLAVSVTDNNAIDEYYMFRKIHLLDLRKKKLRKVSDNPGKLGKYSFSPDGKRLAFVAARLRADHAVTDAFVLDLASGKAKVVTPKGLVGHVRQAHWRGDSALLLFSHEGAEGTLRQVSLAGGAPRLLYDSGKQGRYCAPLHVAVNGEALTLDCSSGTVPSELRLWPLDQQQRVLTRLNGWVGKKRFGRQEVIHHKTRDGIRLNGLLVKPVGFRKGKRYPLLVIVHGGPEANFTSAWSTRYSRPAQLLAGKGYLVFMPNYRSSTGYGAALPRTTIGDAGGKEFDDIIDGIKHLVASGMADKDRVGLFGGSYGGYAAGLFGTRHTKWVRAVGMFVGVSDLISKRGVSDIPYEVLYVHHGAPLEKMWKLSLERSPIYWAHRSKTAFLIYGGNRDTRVPPDQSVEMYLRLKMNKHPAVRLVQYPGEGHGNRKQPGRLDVLLRVARWMDWYVRDKKPLTGPMPPADLSKAYGVELDEGK